MAGRVHVLLVGIDTYPEGVSSLAGCVNDVERAEVVLRHRATGAGDEVVVTRLTNERASRQRFIDTFRTTFAAAEPGDTAVFYYAGHGSQEPAAPEHLEFEPDGLNETLVLADSRVEGGYDLADKELAVLVAEVSARSVHMLVILDCCHSGSGVRDLGASLVRVRRAPTSTTHRSADSYLTGTTERGALAANGELLGGGKYVLIAACRSDQTAKEVVDGTVSRGAMSVAMESVLSATSGPITYAQLHRAVGAAVVGVVARQTPVLECPDPRDADRPFLGGGAGSAAPLLTASHQRGQWRLDAGLLHGIPASSADGRATRLTLHPLTAGDLAENAALTGAATTTVRVVSSDLAVDDPAVLDPTATYRAVVRDLPTATITVSVDAAMPTTQRTAVVETLSTAEGLAVVEDAADIRVATQDGELVLLRPGAYRSLVARRSLPADDGPFPDTDLDDLRDEVVQVGRWLSLWQRRNPSSTLDQAAVTIEALDTADQTLPVTGGGVQVSYNEQDEPEGPRIRVRVRNQSSRRLYVAVLALSELYGVEALLTGGGEWLDPGSSLFVPADDGTNNLYLSVPPGEQLTTDLLKLLVSTSEFSATALRQADLTPPETRAPTRGPSLSVRGISTKRPPRLPETGEDWTTRELLVTTYREGTEVAVPPAGRTAALDEGVSLQGHSALRAKVRLSPGSEAAREALIPLLPAALADHPDSEPFSFLRTRSMAGEIDVLELDDVAGAEGVTADNPLVLQVQQSLGDDEYILPIGFDGEDYLPLGLGTAAGADRSVIRIDRLPVQNTITRRSLGGSLKILFRKLVARRVGVAYDWPHLSLVRYDEGTGKPRYEYDPDAVRAGLTGASTVLLLVHGIIGDTRGMSQAAGPGPAGAPPGFAEGFDAVLALDYENLHTTIETSGADLAAALRAVGVDVDDPSGPRLTVVAHSMGGLVSRCFIEREGGHAVVDRLVTCGTPHAGSPWPRVQDSITSLLGLGLNGVIPLSGPLATIGGVLAFLAGAVERVDNALDEMRPGSPLLRELSTAPAPGVPYVVIRGTQPLPPGSDPGVARRIVQKLTGSALDLLFGGQPNDLAVSVDSATAVGKGWPAEQRPRPIDAACNHLTYFSGGTGLDAVQSALTD